MTALATGTSFAAERGVWTEYLVRRGDQLGRVLQSFEIIPLYGRRGSIRRTIELNPGKILGDGNVIEPGTMILLPKLRTPELVQRSAPQPKAAKAPSRRIASSEDEVGMRPDPSDLERAREPQVRSSYREPVAYVGDSFNDRFAINFAPQGNYSGLIAQDRGGAGKATLPSDLGFGFRIGFDHHFAERWAYTASYRLAKQDFRKPRNRTLDHASNTLNEFSVALGYLIAPRFSFAGMLAFTERLFPVATSLTALDLDKAIVPRLQGMLRYELIRVNSFGLGLSGGAGILFPARADGYTVHFGYNYFGRVDTRHRISRVLTVTTGARMDQAVQSSSQVNQTTTGMVYEMGFIFNVTPSSEGEAK